MPITTDAEGFLVNLDDWSEEVAQVLADEDGITLSAEHWRVIHAVRAFHQTFETSPGMRQLNKWLKTQGNEDLASSIALLKLFPGSPAKHVARVAGLPKPENCL